VLSFRCYFGTGALPRVLAVSVHPIPIGFRPVLPRHQHTPQYPSSSLSFPPAYYVVGLPKQAQGDRPDEADDEQFRSNDGR